jgi:hypothetical protein
MPHKSLVERVKTAITAPQLGCRNAAAHIWSRSAAA